LDQCWCPFQKQKVKLIRLLVRLKEQRHFGLGEDDPMLNLCGDHGLDWEILRWDDIRSVAPHN
jgi:hypothetical protein